MFNYANERDILDYVIIAYRIRVRRFFLMFEQYCLKIVAEFSVSQIVRLIRSCRNELLRGLYSQFVLIKSPRG